MKKLACIVGSVAALLAGCEEKAATPSGPPAPPYARPEAMLPEGVPAGWTPGPESEVRSASYLVQGDAGAVADVSLVILPGQPGGLQRNVNGWRRQLGQPPLEAAAFEKSVAWITTLVGDGALVDIKGPADAASASFDGRIVAVVVERPAHSWIFQMRGNAGVVDAQRSAFLNWVGGVTPVGQGGAVSSGPRETAAPVVAKQPAPGARPTWRVPDNWAEEPAGETACARFTVSGPDDHPGEITVILLEGDGGGVLGNVNRWRQDAGLTAIAPQELAGRIQTVFSGSTRISMIQVAGPRESTTAAWFTREEGTWIFRITGPATVIDAERSRFAMFLRTVAFPEP